MTNQTGAPDSGKVESDSPSCSFCGRGWHQVRKLVAQPPAYICEQCVLTCVDVLLPEIPDLPDLTSRTRERLTVLRAQSDGKRGWRLFALILLIAFGISSPLLWLTANHWSPRVAEEYRRLERRLSSQHKSFQDFCKQNGFDRYLRTRSFEGCEIYLETGLDPNGFTTRGVDLLEVEDSAPEAWAMQEAKAAEK